MCQKDKKRLMEIGHDRVSTQQALLGTNAIQVNVSIDVTQWDRGYVLLGREGGWGQLHGGREVGWGSCQGAPSHAEGISFASRQMAGGPKARNLSFPDHQPLLVSPVLPPQSGSDSGL